MAVITWNFRDSFRRSRELLYFASIILTSLALPGLITYPVFLVLFVVLVALSLAVIIARGITSIYFNRLESLALQHQWKELLRVTVGLERCERFLIPRTRRLELSLYKAKAAAASGDLDGAIMDVQKLSDAWLFPRWQYFLLVAELCDLAHRYGSGIAFREKAVALNPAPSIFLGLADCRLQYEKNIVKAREALNEAEKGGFDEGLMTTVYRSYGILRYLEGDYALAEEKLREAIRRWESLGHADSSAPHSHVAEAYLCCTLAKQARLPEARQYFNEAKEYLVTTQRTEILQECEALLGS